MCHSDRRLSIWLHQGFAKKRRFRSQVSGAVTCQSDCLPRIYSSGSLLSSYLFPWHLHTLPSFLETRLFLPVHPHPNPARWMQWNARGWSQEVRGCLGHEQAAGCPGHKGRNCIVIFSPCRCCVGQESAPCSVEIWGGIIRCLWGNTSAEIPCILLYSAIEKYDSRVRLRIPRSSFIHWVENDVT